MRRPIVNGVKRSQQNAPVLVEEHDDDGNFGKFLEVLFVLATKSF